MGKVLGSASACEEHQWKGLNGVCASCLRNRLIAIVSSRASCYARQSSTPKTYMSAAATDVDRTSSTLSDDIFFYSPADASFLWQRSDSAEKGGLQRGRNSKELRLCDPKDDDSLCLVYFDADAVDPDLRHRHEKGYKIVAADSCRKAGGAGDAFAAQRTDRYPRTSSLRMDGALKNSEKKSKAFWTPSTILRRLFSSSKATMTRRKTQQPEEFSDDLRPATNARGSLARGASLREGAASGSVCKSNSSSEMPGSPEKMHPLRRVIPVTSTGCYDRITETMRHEYPIHIFSCQSCSKLQPIHHLAANCSKSVRTSKAVKPSSKLGSNMDLEKHFKGAASSWSKSNPVVEPEIMRRPSYNNQSPAHSGLFYKDHMSTQSSFRSSPMQTRKCRPRKKTSTHGIFQLSPYSLGNDAWNCHHLSPATYKRTSQLPKHRLT